LLVAIKDLGRNLSPFPRPISNSNLVTTGIYRFTRHPMYYSLIFISVGVFITKLSIYFLFLSISLGVIIKFKIALEEQYLNNKFKNYLLYKNEVKY
jgi:protein-S-isoprenylcysteine O-methyltransferase Ste14